MQLSLSDRKFLHAIRVNADNLRYNDKTFLKACGILPERITWDPNWDDTQRTLAGMGLDPYNRTEYLRLACLGAVPDEIDPETESMLPDGIRLADMDDSESETD